MIRTDFATMHRHSSRRFFAFTLVELMVVIAIIALLIGVLLPALSAAKKHARDMREIVATRQLSIAYTMRADDFKGKLLKGKMTEPEAAAQPPIADKHGNNIVPLDLFTTEMFIRWPWHLSPYLNQGIIGSILVNQQADSIGTPPSPSDSQYATKISGWAYSVSALPSFGLNTFNVGGWLDVKTHLVSRIDQPAAPSHLILFAAGRWNAQDHGYVYVDSPKAGSNTMSGGQWSAADWKKELSIIAMETAEQWGYVDARCGSQRVPVGFFDGHSAFMDVNDDMRDMTYWSDEAYKLKDSNFSPKIP